MRLSQDAIRRMVGNGNGVVGGGGGGGDIAGMATQAWVNENYLSIEFFSKLFKAYDSASTPNEIKPNDTQSTITNIKAMFGFWTQQYISALGQNSGGGGGGGTDLNEPLSSINDAGLGIPTAAGQVLTWNGSQWVYNIPGGGGGGTVTSITAGTGLSGGTITTMGTIAINSTYQGYIQHGETAYGWGNHASAGYATPSSVASQMQNYAYISNGAIHIGNNSITPLTSHQSVYGTFWGKSWSNGGTVSGNIEAGNNGGAIEGFHSIELNTHGTLTNYGGFIDFHFNGSSGDYTSRIIEDASGRIRLMADNGVRIGNGVLLWDETNNALKVQRYDGTASNLYTTGGVSALGMSAGASSIDAMTFGYVTITNRLSFDDGNYQHTIYGDENGNLVINGSEGVKIDADLYMQSNNIAAQYMTAKRFYVGTNRYIYLDSSNVLKYYDNGIIRTIAFN